MQSGAGDIRIGPILAVPQVLQSLGARTQTVFARAGVPLSLFRNPDARLPLEAAGRLFGECARLTGCPHFGLLVGERFSLDGLGPLGELMRHSPSVGSALRSLLVHLHLHDRGAAPLLLQPERDTALLGYSVYRHATPGTELIYDAALAIGHRILLRLCGPGFAPLAVQFSCRRPARIADYRRVFRAPVNFDAEVTGIAFASSWLAHPIAGADAGRHEALTLALQQAQAASPLSLGEQVELVLHQMLLSGHGTAGEVAQLFGCSQRTLRRRLDIEGRGFQALVNRTRHELACQLLHNTLLPVTHIAAALQYADATAFTRAFRQWTGCSPTAWRARDPGLAWPASCSRPPMAALPRTGARCPLTPAESDRSPIRQERSAARSPLCRG